MAASPVPEPSHLSSAIFRNFALNAASNFLCDFVMSEDRPLFAFAGLDALARRTRPSDF